MYATSIGASEKLASIGKSVTGAAKQVNKGYGFGKAIYDYGEKSAALVDLIQKHYESKENAEVAQKGMDDASARIEELNDRIRDLREELGDDCPPVAWHLPPAPPRRREHTRNGSGFVVLVAATSAAPSDPRPARSMRR